MLRQHYKLTFSGPYAIDCAKGLLSDVVHRQAQAAPYQGLDQYAQDRTDRLQYLEGYVFEQNAIPLLWQQHGAWAGFQGIPAGLARVAGYQAWQDCRILLIPEMPSRHTGTYRLPKFKA